VNAPYWVLDTGALVAFAHGVEAVGQVLVDVADIGGTVAVPAVCLVEAYSLLQRDEYELLKMLRRNPTVLTLPLGVDLDHRDDCPGVGSMTRHTGRVGAGHAVYAALITAAGVVTSRPDQIRAVLGPDGQVIEV